MTMCVPWKCTRCSLPPSVMVSGGGSVRRWPGHKGEALTSGISVLIRDPKGLPTSSCPARTQQQDSRLWTRKWVGSHSKSATALIFQPILLSCENTFLLFRSHPICGIRLQQPEGTKVFRKSSHLPPSHNAKGLSLLENGWAPIMCQHLCHIYLPSLPSLLLIVVVPVLCIHSSFISNMYFIFRAGGNPVLYLLCAPSLHMAKFKGMPIE